MAMVCKTGARECDGCMNCQDDDHAIHICVGCGRRIYAGDIFYSVLGELYCENCVSLELA